MYQACIGTPEVGKQKQNGFFPNNALIPFPSRQENDLQHRNVLWRNEGHTYQNCLIKKFGLFHKHVTFSGY